MNRARRRLVVLARTQVGLAAGALGATAIAAGVVRLLPWVLSPAVPLGASWPFARGLAALSLEAALLVGWPIGWALAAYQLVERGDARVLQSLGERPSRTVAALTAQAAWLGAALASVSMAVGRDAGAPGRVVSELLEESRVACAAAASPMTYSIPFTTWTWLCAPDSAPRLVGAPPGISSAVATARAVHVAGDLRAVELSDARVLLGRNPVVALHATSMKMRGLAPWIPSSVLPGSLRAALVASTAAISAALAAWLIVGAPSSATGPLSSISWAFALSLGAVGPLAALGCLRLLERAHCAPVAFGTCPMLSAVVTLGWDRAARWLGARLSSHGLAGAGRRC